MRTNRHTLLGLVLALVVAGCVIGPAPLSRVQLREYLRDQQIQPLLVEEVGGAVTVVLWKDARKLGCYVVWSRSGIEAHQQTDYLSSTQQGTVPEPITIIYNPVFNSGIICLTINDPLILQQAQSIELTYPDGEVKTLAVNGQENMIISRFTRSAESRTRIVIYGKNRQVLYDRYRFN